MSNFERKYSPGYRHVICIGKTKSTSQNCLLGILFTFAPTQLDSLCYFWVGPVLVNPDVKCCIKMMMKKTKLSFQWTRSAYKVEPDCLSFFFFLVMAVASNQTPLLRHDFTTSPPPSHALETSSLKLARLCGKSLNNNEQNQLF